MIPTNNVIDLSHHNTVTSFQQAQQSEIVGVIHKATQGVSVVDAEYQTRRALARANGLLWGAYHFGVRGRHRAAGRAFSRNRQSDQDGLARPRFRAEPGRRIRRDDLSRSRSRRVRHDGQRGNRTSSQTLFRSILHPRNAWKQSGHAAQELLSLDRQILQRLAHCAARMERLRLLAIHRRQLRRPTPPSSLFGSVSVCRFGFQSNDVLRKDARQSCAATLRFAFDGITTKEFYSSIFSMKSFAS